MLRLKQQMQNNMEITWYGNASIVLKEDDTTIAFDPFCGLNIGDIKDPPKVLPYSTELREAKHVFVTHGHFDHIYHIPFLYGEANAKIYCTAAPERKLRSKGLANICRISPGAEINVGPFKVQTWQGRHCRFDALLIAKTILRADFFRHPGHLTRLLGLDMSYNENRETLFYQVTVNGYRIQVMGSMNLDRNTDYPIGADVLVLPLQGRSDQDTYALGILERLKPDSVFLDHYNDAFPPFSSQVDVSRFIRNAGQRLGIPCIPLKQGEPISPNMSLIKNAKER